MDWSAENQVLIQGIVDLSADYAAGMKAYGTNIVGIVSPGEGAQTVKDIQIFDLVEEAVDEVGEIQTTLLFVEAYSVLDAAKEAIASGIKQIVIISRNVPPLDMVCLLKKAQQTNTTIIGPGSNGIVIPEKLWLGNASTQFYHPGKVGMIGRTHSINYEIALELKQAGLGQSLAVSLGNEDIITSTFEQWLDYLNEDKATEAIVLAGKAGSILEEAVAPYIVEQVKKTVIVYLAGVKAPVERPLIDAATIVASGLSYSAPVINQSQQTLEAFQKAKIPVAMRISEIPDLLEKALK